MLVFNFVEPNIIVVPFFFVSPSSEFISHRRTAVVDGKDEKSFIYTICATLKSISTNDEVSCSVIVIFFLFLIFLSL